MTRYTGYDSSGIARVWAEHENPVTAQTMCWEEAKLYVAQRPDTGPLGRWSFTHRPRRDAPEQP
jgi:hypothetical protein